MEVLETTLDKLSEQFNEWVLDFSNIQEMPISVILGLVSQVLLQKHSGHSFTVIAPKKGTLAKELRDKGFLHLLDSSYPTSPYQGALLYPATQYTDSDRHFEIVNDIFRVILSGAEGISRADYAALEWAINEISDNVLVHSGSPAGGLLMINKIDRKNKRIHFLVADSGSGITATLGNTFQGQSDTELLDKAVKEGITRDKNVGQGNGLYGSYAISHQGKGTINIVSNNAALLHEKGLLSVKRLDFSYKGTIVDVTVDFSEKNLMASALTINGKQFTPIDFIELGYEDPDEEQINFNVSEEANSYGTRQSGSLLRSRLLNIYEMYTSKIIINFNNLPVISSSFADEVIGKVILALGEATFRARFVVVCSDEQNNKIIQRSVAQRLEDLSNVQKEAA
ncbi:STAS-like domain-containing protein [Vibrio parahaemolyticus]